MTTPTILVTIALQVAEAVRAGVARMEGDVRTDLGPARAESGSAVEPVRASQDHRPGQYL